MGKLKLSDINKTTKHKLTRENLIKYGAITKAKADIAWHPAKRKVIIGGKGTGKTHIPNIKAIFGFENSEYFNAFGFRKYQQSAYDALGSYFSSTLAILKQLDFELRIGYEMRSYNFYRLRDKRNMMNNQVFRFGSLENASGSTDGKAPANGGYFGIVSIDEPVVEKDMGNPDKIPGEEKFNQDMFIIRDNLERYNDTFEAVFKDEKKPIYEEFFTMNDWGDHPLTIKAQKVFPVEEFFEYNFSYSMDEILGNKELINTLFENQEWVDSLILNNTLSRYDKEDNTLYSRMTKFANPNNLIDKRRLPLLDKIKQALIKNNMNTLAILMGYRHTGNTEYKMKVYGDEVTDKIKRDMCELKDLTDKGYKLTRVNYAWDIDTSRVLTLTPTFMLEKDNIFNRKTEKIVFIDRQIEIKADGSGVLGERNDLYIKHMSDIMSKHYEALDKTYLKHVMLNVDDKRKWFLHELYKIRPYFITHYQTAKQHGAFDISHRQNAFIMGISNDTLFIHKKNGGLYVDLKVCVKRDIKDPRRKTSGSTNYLDRIDSAEYGIEPFTTLLWRKGA